MNPLADLDDAAGSFGDRDEATRRQYAAFRVLPAHQGFHPPDRTRPKIHDRLVVESRFASADGPGEVGCQMRVVVGSITVLGCVAPVLGPAG